MFQGPTNIRIDFCEDFEILASQFVERRRSHGSGGSIARSVIEQRAFPEKIARHQGRNMPPEIVFTSRDANDTAGNNVERVAGIVFLENYFMRCHRLRMQARG